MVLQCNKKGYWNIQVKLNYQCSIYQSVYFMAEMVWICLKFKNLVKQVFKSH